jgi:hypothetical protein
MIADLLIVDGDPVKDITVLQKRSAIETVIQDGKVVVFDEERVNRSWPHERYIGYSIGDLTYELVHGDEQPPGLAHDLDALPGAEEAGDLVSALSVRETGARIPD